MPMLVIDINVVSAIIDSIDLKKRVHFRDNVLLRLTLKDSRRISLNDYRSLWTR